jgi:hypothetical protein
VTAAAPPVGFRDDLRAKVAAFELERAAQERRRLEAFAVERERRSAEGLAEAAAAYLRWERRAGRLPGDDSPTLPGL